jgi:hypothetical protein
LTLIFGQILTLAHGNVFRLAWGHLSRKGCLSRSFSFTLSHWFLYIWYSRLSLKKPFSGMMLVKDIPEPSYFLL